MAKKIKNNSEAAIFQYLWDNEKQAISSSLSISRVNDNSKGKKKKDRGEKNSTKTETNKSVFESEENSYYSLGGDSNHFSLEIDLRN